MISICPGCSGADIDLLEEKFGKNNIDLGCIGECGGRDGLIIGYSNNKFIEAITDEEFINFIDKQN